MRIISVCLLLVWSSLALAAQGDLIRLKELPSYTTQEIKQALGSCSHSFPDAPPTNKIGAANIRFFAVTYETLDVTGEPAIVSGALLFPDTGKGPFSLVSYQHGTTFGKDEVPSRNNEEIFVAGGCYASQGWAVVAADYLGYGDSNTFHPYLHVQTEATAAADLLRAAKQAAKQLGIEFSDQLFLAGYSQGGGATMALHRFLEHERAHEIKVTASAPMAGPYDLEKTFLELAKHPSDHTVVELGFGLWAFNQIYHFSTSLHGIVKEAYADKLDSIFSGQLKWEDVLKSLPANLNDFIEPQFLTDTQNPDHPWRQALRENNSNDWVPTAPVFMYQGAEDIEVPTFNTSETCERMKKAGAKNVNCEFEPHADHGGGFSVTIPRSIKWFSTF